MPSLAQRPGNVRQITLIAIDERPSGYDPVIAASFSRFRARLGLPREALAHRLGLSPWTLDALETGNLKQLPPIATLHTALRTYGRMAGFDAEGVITRLQAQTRDRPMLPQAHSRNLLESRQSHPRLSVEPRRNSGRPVGKRAPSRTRGVVLALLLAIPVGLGAILMLSEDLAPHPVFAVQQTRPAGWLAAEPDSVRRNYSGRNLRWIDAAAPKGGKSDRLPARTPLASSR
ncbi:MAG: helix-turn-helix domain-containing protein [Hyphomicrobiaceae bacterium]